MPKMSCEMRPAVFCAVFWVSPTRMNLAGASGATLPGAGIHDWQAMLIELALTAGLVSTILGTASTAQNVGGFSAIAVGGYIALAGLWASPVSGASMNPARSLAPALVSGYLSGLWIYLVAPVLGAGLGVIGCRCVREHGCCSGAEPAEISPA